MNMNNAAHLNSSADKIRVSDVFNELNLDDLNASSIEEIDLFKTK